MMQTEILAHRGLEPSKKDFYSESTYEAFMNHLSRGFGIEFDVNFTQDGIIIAHDSTLERITQGEDRRSFRELTTKEASQVILAKGRLGTFDEIMDLIAKSSSKINALHLKGKFQEQKDLDVLLENLARYPDLLSRILIFDVKPEAARYLKGRNKSLILAPSVADTFDIERYNSAVLGTLASLEDAIKYRDLYDWVWLDEWDRKNETGGDKKFYTKETFERLRKVGYKIALVTPELHATSPGLLGGESHPDAVNKEVLFRRIKEILELGPDAICTDYPQQAMVML